MRGLLQMAAAFGAAAALLAAGAAAAEIPHEAWFPGGSSVLEAEIIPPAYRGRWAPDARACADLDGVQRLAIYAAGVDRYESGGRLVRITQSGQPRSVKVRLAYEGEGELWDQDEVWTLSADGGRLEVKPAAGAAQNLLRCR